MDKFKAVILAAGKGTRMNSELPKVLHKCNGLPMVHYSIKAAKDAGAYDVCVIVGYKSKLVMDEIVDYVEYAEQREQLGTGDAVRAARDFIGSEGDTLVLCGDTPLITSKTLAGLHEFHKKNSNGVTVLTAIVDDPSGYGRIIKNEAGEFQAIVEDRDCTEQQRQVKEINSGMYIFNSEALVTSLDMLTNDNDQGEYYLTDTIALIKKTGLKVQAYPASDPEEIMGVNDPDQLKEAERIMTLREEKV